ESRERWGALAPPAGRLEPLCGVRHRQDGDHRAHRGGVAVAPHDARVPRDRHLLAGDVDLAAEDARHDVAAESTIRRDIRAVADRGTSGAPPRAAGLLAPA